MSVLLLLSAGRKSAGLALKWDSPLKKDHSIYCAVLLIYLGDVGVGLCLDKIIVHRNAAQQIVNQIQI